ncbi:MAG: tetratricopeptide repeat protein [Planctomycetota bacterium]
MKWLLTLACIVAAVGLVYGESWVFRNQELRISMNGFEIDQKSFERDADHIYFCSSRGEGDDHITLSIWIEKVDPGGDNKACRNYFKARGVQAGLPKEEIFELEVGEAAVLVWNMELIDLHRNVNAYLSAGTIWVDVHISKNGPPGEELTTKIRKELLAMVGTISLRPMCENMKRVAEATKPYRAKDYSAALTLYNAVIESEKTKATLDRSTLREVYVLLTLCYAFTGKVDQAKATLEAGLKDDPHYPIYLYNMACFHAESNDVPQAIACLRQTYANKDHRNATEGIPDPTKDASFAKLLGNKEFIQLMAEVGVTTPPQSTAKPPAP